MSAKNCHSLTKIVTPFASHIMKPALSAPLHPDQHGTKCESFSFNPRGLGLF